MPVQVAIQYATRRVGVPHPSTVAKWVRTVLRSRKRRAELTVRFVGAQEGRALNRQWRGKPNATNVLSFSGESITAVTGWLGDIVICVPVVQSEAMAQGKSVSAHFAHMVVHGVLHLLDYDHVGEVDARVMEQIETAILLKLGYPDPYLLPR